MVESSNRHYSEIPTNNSRFPTKSSFHTLNLAACNLGCYSAALISRRPKMAKQTELGHVCHTKSGGRAAFSLPLFRFFPSKEFWPSRFQGNPNKHFDGFLPAILPSKPKWQLTHTMKAAWNPTPTCSGRADQAKLTARNKPPKFTFRA